jgi:hypothetical protein
VAQSSTPELRSACSGLRAPLFLRTRRLGRSSGLGFSLFHFLLGGGFDFGIGDFFAYLFFLAR